MRALTLSVFLLSLAACDSAINGSGDVLWRTAAETEALAPTQPLASGDTLFVAYGEQFGALDAESGEPLWTASVRLFGGSAAGAVLDGGDVVYLNYLTWVKAFRKSDGRVLWTAPLDEGTTIDRVRMAQTQTHLFLGRSGEVVRIAKASGEIDLRIDLSDITPAGVPALAYDTVAAPEAGAVFVAVSFFDPQAPEVEGAVVALDAASGTRRWTYRPPSRTSPETGRPLSTAVYGLDVGAGRVYAPVGQTLVALDTNNGSVVWEQAFARDAFDAAPTFDSASGAVYIGSLQANAVALEARTGALRWSTPLSGSLSTPFIVRDGRVYLTSPFEGSAWVLNAATGDVRSRTRPANDVLLAPVAVDGRAVYSVSSTAVYALTR